MARLGLIRLHSPTCTRCAGAFEAAAEIVRRPWRDPGAPILEFPSQHAIDKWMPPNSAKCATYLVIDLDERGIDAKDCYLWNGI